MRPRVLGLVLTFLAACAGPQGGASALHIQREDVPRQGNRASRDASNAETAPSSTEEEAVHRMEEAIAAAELLQHGEGISDEEREALIRSLDGARAAIERYRAARLGKAAHAGTLGAIGGAAAAIVADDATGVGVADDPLLIPLALAAMAAVIRSHAPSTRDELALAWLELGQRLEALEETIAMTSRGNVIHKHLVDEARERAIRRAAAEGKILTESQVDSDLLCEELRRMEQELNKANKTQEWRKVISTQKGLHCRPSRHNRE